MSFQFVPDTDRQTAESQPSKPTKTAPRPKTSKHTMVWTEEHDILLCRKILAVDPFTGTKKGTVQRGSKWKMIVDNLLEVENPKFKIDAKAVRDRYNLLSQKRRKKLKEEEKESGIETAIEEIIEKEDASEEVQEVDSDAKRKAKDAEKGTAEGIRKGWVRHRKEKERTRKMV